MVAQLQRRIEELERRLELESSGRSRAAPVRNSASPDGANGGRTAPAVLYLWPAGPLKVSVLTPRSGLLQVSGKGHLANVCRARPSGN